jgi:methionyl aminopeptidase
MKCPTCAQLGIEGSVFCCQACFKEAWPKHKLTHSRKTTAVAETSGVDARLSAFRNYEFTGKVRPYPMSPQVTVPDDIVKPDYAESGQPISEMVLKRSHHIPVLTPDQMSRMREACDIGRDALDLAGSMIKPGVTGDEIDKAVHEFIVGKKAYPSPLNYFNFPKSCCISINEQICHGIPDMGPLQEGDIVNVDISIYYKGMHSDLNETFFVGTVDKESRRLVEGAYLSLMEAIKQCKPGMMYRELGSTIQRVASLHQLTVVKTYCGHGVGELFHSNPNVAHYYPNKSVGVMRAGHCFTIEPMLNLGTYKDKTWPDQWTAVTCDGKRSAQFEHTLLVTEDGIEILTARRPTSPSMGFDPEALCEAWTRKEDPVRGKK